MGAKVSIFTTTCAFFVILLASWAYGFGEKAASSARNSSSVETVWVSKPDGAEQCAPKSGQSLKSSEDQLKSAHVQVLSSEKGNDGKFHPQMCGISTGRMNSFEIPKADLPKAVVLGFKQVPSP